jgi:hypothetical protein
MHVITVRLTASVGPHISDLELVRDFHQWQRGGARTPPSPFFHEAEDANSKPES